VRRREAAWGQCGRRVAQAVGLAAGLRSAPSAAAPGAHASRAGLLAAGGRLRVTHRQGGAQRHAKEVHHQRHQAALKHHDHQRAKGEHRNVLGQEARRHDEADGGHEERGEHVLDGLDAVGQRLGADGGAGEGHAVLLRHRHHGACGRAREMVWCGVVAAGLCWRWRSRQGVQPCRCRAQRQQLQERCPACAPLPPPPPPHPHTLSASPRTCAEGAQLLREAHPAGDPGRHEAEAHQRQLLQLLGGVARQHAQQHRQQRARHKDGGAYEAAQLYQHLQYHRQHHGALVRRLACSIEQ
jgi:hypothetical protein